MPSRPSHCRRHQPRPFPMPISVECYHNYLTARSRQSRHCRLHSFAHPVDSHFTVSPQFSSRYRSLSTPCFSTMAGMVVNQIDQLSKYDGHLKIIGGRYDHKIHQLILDAAVCIAASAQPVPVSDGHNGAFYLNNQFDHRLAVIKLVDEAALLSVRHSAYSYKAGVREVAAYLLDHGGFARVPPTALIKISHSMLPATTASIQKFVQHEFDAGELGPSQFSVPSVHRIGILDVRILNLDRHAGNILVTNSPHAHGMITTGSLDLVPIDHGFCLPELLEDPYFEWLHWPQASMPFSEHELEYISELDPFRDAEMLRRELPSLSESAIRILIVCTIFLKRAADSGLCLADIGDMMTREFSSLNKGPSLLESLCLQAKSALSQTVSLDRVEVIDEGSGSDTLSNSRFNESDPPASLDTAFFKITGRRNIVLTALQDDDHDDHDRLCAGRITRSASFATGELNTDSGNRWVSFNGLSGTEWTEWLRRFEQLLPDAFEVQKSARRLKQRLGTSCKF